MYPEVECVCAGPPPAFPEGERLWDGWIDNKPPESFPAWRLDGFESECAAERSMLVRWVNEMIATVDDLALSHARSADDHYYPAVWDDALIPIPVEPVHFLDRVFTAAMDECESRGKYFTQIGTRVFGGWDLVDEGVVAETTRMFAVACDDVECGDCLPESLGATASVAESPVMNTVFSHDYPPDGYLSPYLAGIITNGEVCGRGDTPILYDDLPDKLRMFMAEMSPLPIPCPRHLLRYNSGGSLINGVRTRS